MYGTTSTNDFWLYFSTTVAKSMNEQANNCKREQTRQEIELYFALTTV